MYVCLFQMSKPLKKVLKGEKKGGTQLSIFRCPLGSYFVVRISNGCLTLFACKLCTCAHSNFTPVLEDLRSEFYPIEMCVNYIESFIYNWEKFWDF